MRYSKSEILIHKLKGVCKYKPQGNRLVCKICGHSKAKPLELNVFHAGDVLEADTLNYNFQKVEECFNNLGDQLSSISRKVEAIHELAKNETTIKQK